jgi:ABC-2 type transport system ATP-binding protein
VIEAPPAEVAAATKSFGRLVAVDALTFALEAGTVTGFLGPNGAGKSTTLRMIGGLVRPTSGHVRLFGADARRPAARTRLGYMPADPSFLPHLSGTANLDLLAGLRTSPSPDREQAVATLNLDPADLDRPVGEYSSGMRQKLAVVAAVQHRPDLVVLDEPANRLDPIAHHAFITLIRDIAAQGRTVLLSSHVLAEVEEACDSVVLVRSGRLLGVAAVEELRRKASRTVKVTFDHAPGEPPAFVSGAHVDGHVLTGRIPAARPDLIRGLLDEPGVLDLVVEPASLEDVFLDLYTGGPA